MLIRERISGGIMGVVIGDALGLPVQFLTRAEVKKNPVGEMRGGGAFDTPSGTWSDDSSLTLCLAESLVEKGYNINDMAERFVRWYRDGYLTPFDRSFDIGRATAIAMNRLIKGASPLEAGPDNEESNGNGSLMRILPAALYFANLPDSKFMKRICDISKITHGHPRSQLGCCIYALYIQALLAGENPEMAYQNLGVKVQTVFKHTELETELDCYQRIIDGHLPNLAEIAINSTGYVVDTLEAALWCLLTTQSYAEAVLQAVNLGLDSDTVGAVTGGIAGVFYGLESIPAKWLNAIVKKDQVLDLSLKFAEAVEDVMIGRV